MSHQFTVLHISDLHERGPREKERARRYRVLGAVWQKNLGELQQEGPIDLVCFTGDLADWGQAPEYERVSALLDALLKQLGLGRERLFLVPGNHDIDRKILPDKTQKSPEQLAFEKLRSNLHKATPLDVARWLEGGRPPIGFEQEWLDLTLSRQNSYRKFLRTFGLATLLPSAELHPHLGYRVSLQLPTLPFPVQVVGLDSSWLAGDDADSGRLRLTDGQVMRLCLDAEGGALPGFRLALVHHPLSDLADGSQCRTLLADAVHLLLRGHLHESELTEWTDPDRKLRSMAAGCLYEGERADQYPNSCSVIRVQCDATGLPLRYDVRLRSFSARSGHWFDDGGIYRNAPNGRLPIQLAAPPPLQQPPRPTEGLLELLPPAPQPRAPVPTTEAERRLQVARATVLGQLLRDDHSFRRICDATGLPAELFWAAISVSDRWFALLATATESGRTKQLDDALSAAIDPVFRERLKLDDLKSVSTAPQLERAQLYELQLQFLAREAPGQKTARLGFLALKRVWGAGGPQFAELSAHLYGTAENASTAAAENDARLLNAYAPNELALWFAADYLFLFCHGSAQHSFLDSVAEHASALTPGRSAVVSTMLKWLPDGRAKLAQLAQRVREQPLDGLPQLSMQLTLSRLSAIERILVESGDTSVAMAASPASVEFALRIGQLGEIAELLESVGERRPKVFCDYLDRFYQDRTAVVSLARALRRLWLTGERAAPQDPCLATALRCSLPTASELDFAQILVNAQVRTWWLDLLSPPLSEPQLETLLQIYSQPRSVRDRDVSRRWLCTTQNPHALWKRIPADKRAQWIEELTPLELSLMAHLDNRMRPVDQREAADLLRFQARLAQRRH